MKRLKPPSLDPNQASLKAIWVHSLCLNRRSPKLVGRVTLERLGSLRQLSCSYDDWQKAYDSTSRCHDPLFGAQWVGFMIWSLGLL